MLVVLGFLAASLLALLLAPAFWSRAVRLTTMRIKNAMPLTESEIRADKDRMRAEYAIQVHRLESQLEQIKLAATRQQIALNRRDARINGAQAEIDRLRTAVEEGQNARRVLEQTITERLPRVAGRVDEAKQLVQLRDHEVDELVRTADRQGKALAEAAAINAQQQSEIERLNTALSTRGARRRDRMSDPRFDEDVALRSELDSLRAKTRDQALLIASLQAGAAREASAGASEPLRPIEAKPHAAADGALPPSSISLKARVQSLEAENAQLTDTVQRLSADLVSSSNHAARQAEHFTAELKRLGAGSLPASGQPRRPSEPRLTLAERVSQARGNPPPVAAPATTQPRPDQSHTDQAGVGRDTRRTLQPVKAPPKPTVDVLHGGSSRAPGNVAPSAAGQAPSAGSAPFADAGSASITQVEPAASTVRPRLLDRISGIGRPT